MLHDGKQWITIQVSWPLSWECWAIESHLETTFAHKTRTRSTHKFAVAHFILVLFDRQIWNLVYVWSDMSSTTPPWMRFRCNTWETLQALQFLSAEHSFSACLIIKSLLVVTCKYLQMVYASSATMSNWSKNTAIGHLRDAAQVEHARSISSAVSTPPLVALHSSRVWKDRSSFLCLSQICWKSIPCF